MFARLTALVGSGGGLPFDLLEAYPAGWLAWEHYKGKLKADGSPVSVFRISSADSNALKLQAARNGAKRLRTVRVRQPGAAPSSAALRTLDA
jgi:SCY1-like protein 1